jgi:hypothetical protein
MVRTPEQHSPCRGALRRATAAKNCMCATPPAPTPAVSIFGVWGSGARFPQERRNARYSPGCGHVDASRERALRFAF